jgi:hypothetical protein
MLARIARSSIECREEVVVAKLRAVRAPSPELRLEHERLADKWQQLADTFDQAARVSGYLQWSSQRLRD